MPVSYQRTKRQRLMRGIRKMPGLVGYWPLNEAQGTIIHDYSVNQNNGTMYGTNSYLNAQGLYGRGYAFDGTSSNGTIGDIASYHGTNMISAFAILKPGGTVNEVGFNTSFGKTAYFWIEGDNSGVNQYQYFINVNGIDSNGVLTQLSTNKNQIFGLSYDSTSGSMLTYLNGTLAQQVGSIGTLSINTNPVVIGNRQGFTRYFYGTANHMGLLNQTLSANQHRKLAHLAGFI